MTKEEEWNPWKVKIIKIRKIFRCVQEMSYFLVIKYKAIRTKGKKDSKKIKTEKDKWTNKDGKRKI